MCPVLERERLNRSGQTDSKNKAGLTQGFWLMAMTCTQVQPRVEKQLKFVSDGRREYKESGRVRRGKKPLGIIGNYLKKL